MDRYENMFNQLDAKSEGAFVPFVTIGDPNKNQSVEIISALIEGGADALELGIPFSDPIADGPTIQKASIRALAENMRPSDCFDIIKQVRESNDSIPIGLLLYSNLVLRHGIEAFYAAASEAGVDSILVADVPVRESAPFIAAAEKTGIKQILIAPPNATEETMAMIAKHSAGYTYLLGRAGVTGAEVKAEMPASQLVAQLKNLNVAPPLLGFGISSPEQVSEAISAGAAGAISGSATVKIIETNLGDSDKMKAELAAFVSSMKAATKK